MHTFEKAYLPIPDDSAVIALFVPDPTLALPLDEAQAPESLHVSLAYLPGLSEMTAADTIQIIEALDTVASQWPADFVTVAGDTLIERTRRDGTGQVVMLDVDGDEVSRLAKMITDELTARGIEHTPLGDYPFHVTLMVTDDPRLSGFPMELAEPWQHTASGVTLGIGGHDMLFPLWSDFDYQPSPQLTVTKADGAEPAEVGLLTRLRDWLNGALEDDDAVHKSVAAFSKSTDVEKRYTFGPWYIPSTDPDNPHLDTHEEFVVDDELQESLWDYMRKGDRRIRLQHLPSMVAGEFVELATWPYEATVDLTLPQPDEDGEALTKAATTTVTLPANTPYMGVVWEPWAWKLVQKGKIRGFSMGGRARRMFVDLDAELDAPDPTPAMM